MLKGFSIRIPTNLYLRSRALIILLLCLEKRKFSSRERGTQFKRAKPDRAFTDGFNPIRHKTCKIKTTAVNFFNYLIALIVEIFLFFLTREHLLRSVTKGSWKFLTMQLPPTRSSTECRTAHAAPTWTCLLASRGAKGCHFMGTRPSTHSHYTMAN